MNTQEKIKIVEGYLGTQLNSYQKAVLATLFDDCKNENQNSGLTKDEIRMLKLQSMRGSKIPGRIR